MPSYVRQTIDEIKTNRGTYVNTAVGTTFVICSILAIIFLTAGKNKDVWYGVLVIPFVVIGMAFFRVWKKRNKVAPFSPMVTEPFL